MHGLERLSGGDLETSVLPADQAFVFQTPIMLRRTARENLLYPPRLQKLGLSKDQLCKEAEEWLNIIGLKGAGDRPAPNLSGGEKQKLALARALICKPKLLFLDEPCSNLDGRSTREIETILSNARTNGTRIILATHDMGQVKRLADDVVFILNGRVHEYSSLDQFMNTPQTTESKAFFQGDIVE
jgi:tungstate transport system ATP-binding protein